MNIFKHLPGNILLLLLAVLMASGTAVSLWTASTRPDPLWQGLWSGIATTCIGVFGTVFLVDYLLKRAEAQRRSHLTFHVRQRASRIAFHETGMMLQIMSRTQESSTHTESLRDADGINRIPDGFAAQVETAVSGNDPWLASLDPHDWQALGRVFERMAREYARLISLFGYEMDVETLRFMLQVEESAHRLSGVIADQASPNGASPATVQDISAITSGSTRNVVAFHIVRVLQVNLEILRTV